MGVLGGVGRRGEGRICALVQLFAKWEEWQCYNISSKLKSISLIFLKRDAYWEGSLVSVEVEVM